MNAQPRPESRQQWLIVALSLLPIVWTAVLMVWLAGASELAGRVVEERGSGRSRLDFGGNSAEVYSHWLDFAVMSGNAITLGWLLLCEWIAVRKWHTPPGPRFLVMLFPLLAVGLSLLVSSTLDEKHGEHTAVFAIQIFFVPLLAASYLLARGVVRRLANLPIVFLSVVAFSAAHFLLQLRYEPSVTGAPNESFIPIAYSVVLILAILRFLVAHRHPDAREPLITNH